MKSPNLLETVVAALKHLPEKLHASAHQEKPAEPPVPKSEHPVLDRVEKAMLHLPPGNFPLP